MTQFHPHPTVITAVELGVHRYRATVAQVAPARLQDQLAQFDRAMIGISLGSKYSQGAHLEASLKWLSEHFKTFGVIVADSVYRYTLQVTQDIDPDEAYELALRTGQEFVEMHRPLFAQYARPGQCEIVFLADVLPSPRFQHYHAQLQQLYREDPAYRASVEQFAQLYLRRGEKVGEALDDARVRKEQLAVAYLLEESAAVACLKEQGWPLQVYPGSINTFVDIVEGRILAAPVDISNLGARAQRLSPGGQFALRQTAGWIPVLQAQPVFLEFANTIHYLPQANNTLQLCTQWDSLRLC